MSSAQSIVGALPRITFCAFAIPIGCVAMRAPADAEPRPLTHPLMPGIRSPEMHNPDWARVHHDKLATGFSPLVCGMTSAPVEWASIPVPGHADWLYVLSEPGRDDALLVNDRRLRLITIDGAERWSRSSVGGLYYYGDLHGDGRPRLLMGSGRHLVELDAATGRTLWTHDFEPEHVSLLIRIADVLPAQPGLEAAVFLNHGEEGSLINFPPGDLPGLLWQRRVVPSGEFDERYDHHSGIEVDLSQPDAPVIWNLRRHRCRGIDARTGEVISSLEYEIAGEPRRNYGTWSLGTGGDGTRIAVVVGESVQLHVHAIRLHRSGRNELAWQHYYGEVYKDAPGVALAHLATGDLDGDGVTEVAYSVRDPQQDYRSFVRVRDGETGSIEFELADYWGSAVVPSQRADSPALLLMYAAPEGATPTQGDLEAHVVNGPWPPRRIGVIPNGKLLHIVRGSSARGELYVRQSHPERGSCIGRYRWTTAAFEQASLLGAETLCQRRLQAVLRRSDGSEVFVTQSDNGELIFTERDGKVMARVPLHAVSSPTLSAADLDLDRRAELLVQLPQGRLRVYSFRDDGEATLRFDEAHAARWFDHAPLSYDLDDDARPEIVHVRAAADGRLAISPAPLGGGALWQTKLDVFADEVTGCVINAGDFLAPDHAAVAVSVTDARLVREGTYLLDGRSGVVRWFKSRYRDGATVMPYRPRGVPTAVDFDGDGTEEIGMDLLSYMAFLRGSDGSFAYVRPTPNIRTEGSVYAGHLYNTYCPLFATSQADKPHWFVIGGFGPFGLTKPDPTEGIWRIDLGYDVPPKIGLVDVDGDGRLEAGYAAMNDETFVCRDVWSGKVEWELKLPSPPNSPAYSADVDGDGKGEFLTASFCIGTDADGNGQLRWQAPTAMGWGAIADFDGDGKGEIACQMPGRVVILHSPRSTPGKSKSRAGRPADEEVMGRLLKNGP